MKQDNKNISGFDATVIIDIEQAFEVLQQAGPEAFAVFFALESQRMGEDVTIERIAEVCNLDKPTIEKACYRLGLVNLGIQGE